MAYRKKSLPLTIELKRQIFYDAVYDYTTFKNLCNIINKVDGVRIYIACFPNDSTDPRVPSGFEGMATLIYTPCNRNNTTNYYEDSNFFYYIHPFKGLTNIPKDIAIKWVTEYRDNIMPELTKIVNANGGVSITDTQSVLHKNPDFKELIAEMECQESLYIRASFTSYTNTEGQDVNEEYKARLTIDFELIDGDGKVIYVEERPRLKLETNQKMFDLNNGDLCPPLNCEGSSI